MAVPPHGYLGYNKSIPHGGETALMFAARVGDLESARLLLDAGANVNDADAWGVSAVTLAAHSGFTALVEFLLDRGANPNHAEAGFAPLHEALMRRDTRMITALLNHGADPNIVLKTWTPTRRSADDFNFHPALVGTTPYWLAARFLQPDMMRLLVERGADPKFVHHITYIAEAGFGQAERTETVTPLMAALGAIRVQPWTGIDPRQRDTLLMATVKLAIDQGSDINLANNDGRTPLDAAKALKNDAVVKYLESKGAKAGTALPARPARPSAAN
jgi:ankyrin repeat protein